MAFVDLRLPRPGPLPAVPAEAWPAAGLLAAVALATGALFGHPAMFALAAVAAVAAGIAFYEPRVIGPMLVLALPLEISKLAVPFLRTRADLGGGLPPTSIVDAGRLVVALACAVWLLRPGRPRREVLPSSPLVLPLALLFTVYALSMLYAIDVSAARTETLRLAFSLGTFALVPFFVRDRASLRWTLYAFVFMMGALSIIGIYQEFSGRFLWNPGLGLYGQRRINTTFADPNDFARFLIEGVAVALALWFFARRRTKVAFLLPAMLLALLTLEFTGSRGSWIVALVTLPATIALLPIARALRLRMLGMGAALLVAAALALVVSNPYFSNRVDTFKFGVAAAGARPYLVEAGLNMFTDHPLTGVGIGGYQTAFVYDYYHYKDPKIHANVTISHTSLVTMLAELGVIGMAALAFLAWRWLAYIRRVLAAGDGELRAVVVAMAMISAIILLASQTEGRFLEDPYLWFAAGIVVAAEAIAAPALPPAASDDT